MPNTFDNTGLQVKSLTELKEELTESFKSIYGSDINLDQNSPDGQILDIFAQAGVDIREILSQINASFDPDQAYGRVLDQRVGINGLTRNGGTYTIVPVEITTDRPVSFIGLDDQSEELNPTVSGLYTLKNDAGDLFYLIDSQSALAAGTYTYSFRAAEIGSVLVSLNTITTPDTVLAGVTGINNPSGATTQGVDEETDADLKIRRAQSTAIPAVGPLDSIQSRLLNTDGVSFAKVYENSSNTTTDPNGTLPNHIWCIVDGGSDADIAKAIYNTKAPGVGMRGSESEDTTRADGSLYTINFDRPTDQDLYIEFTLGGTGYDSDFVKESIVNNVTWDVGQAATGDVITSYLKSLNSDYVVTAMTVSDDGATYAETVDPTNVNYRFINSTARITIN